MKIRPTKHLLENPNVPPSRRDSSFCGKTTPRRASFPLCLPSPPCPSSWPTGHRRSSASAMLLVRMLLPRPLTPGWPWAVMRMTVALRVGQRPQ